MEQTSSKRSRRELLAATGGVAVGALVAGTRTASAAAGDPVVQGVNNDAGISETLLRSDPGGDKAALAVFNERTSATTTRPDALRVFATGSATGAAIQAFAGAGTFSTAPVHGLAVRGIGTTTGVHGRAIGTGTGVVAEAGAAGATALRAVGPVVFSSAGLATVATGTNNVVVTPGIELTPTTKVFATIQSTGGQLRYVLVDDAANTFRIRLTSNASSPVSVAWFVVS